MNKMSLSKMKLFRFIESNQYKQKTLYLIWLYDNLFPHKFLILFTLNSRIIYSMFFELCELYSFIVLVSKR